MRNSEKGETSQQKKIKSRSGSRWSMRSARSGNQPQWMILMWLPVYRRSFGRGSARRRTICDQRLETTYSDEVINRNKAVEAYRVEKRKVIVRNEKGMLSGRLTRCSDNGRRGSRAGGAKQSPLSAVRHAERQAGDASAETCLASA